MGQRRRITAKGTEARARLLAEATKVFSRDGYRAGSLSRIAEAAGLTQQGLLHYFPSKAELLLAVVAERERSTAAVIEEQSATGSVLDAFVIAVRHNLKEPHLVELMTVLSAESTSPSHPTHDWFTGRYDDLVRRLAAGVAEEQDSGTWTVPIDPQDAARMLVGLADGLRLQRLLGHPELDHPAMLEDFLARMRTGGAERPTSAPPLS